MYRLLITAIDDASSICQDTEIKKYIKKLYVNNNNNAYLSIQPRRGVFSLFRKEKNRKNRSKFMGKSPIFFMKFNIISQNFLRRCLSAPPASKNPSYKIFFEKSQAKKWYFCAKLCEKPIKKVFLSHFTKNLKVCVFCEILPFLDPFVLWRSNPPPTPSPPPSHAKCFRPSPLFGIMIIGLKGKWDFNKVASAKKL